MPLTSSEKSTQGHRHCGLICIVAKHLKPKKPILWWVIRWGVSHPHHFSIEDPVLWTRTLAKAVYQPVCRGVCLSVGKIFSLSLQALWFWWESYVYFVAFEIASAEKKALLSNLTDVLSHGGYFVNGWRIAAEILTSSYCFRLRSCVARPVLDTSVGVSSTSRWNWLQ